jgi:hypothetical protein
VQVPDNSEIGLHLPGDRAAGHFVACCDIEETRETVFLSVAGLLALLPAV